MSPACPAAPVCPACSPAVCGSSTLTPRRSKRRAWKFIKWFAEPEQQAEWYAGSGWMPANKRAFEMPAAKEVQAEYPQFKTAADLYLAAPSTTAALGALLGPYADIRDIVVRAIEETVLEDKDPVAAVNDAAKEANDLLEKYNSRVE